MDESLCRIRLYSAQTKGLNLWKVDLSNSHWELRHLSDGPRRAADEWIDELAEQGPEVAGAIELVANPRPGLLRVTAGRDKGFIWPVLNRKCLPDSRVDFSAIDNSLSDIPGGGGIVLLDV